MNKELEQKIRDILEKETCIDTRNGNEIGYEISLDYDEELSETELAKISRSDDPEETFYDIEGNWVTNAEDYYYPELMETIRKNMEDEEFDENEDDIIEWVRDNVYWYLPDSFGKQTVDVVIALDTGDANTDFTESNILNWYGRDGGYNPKGTIPEKSPIRFIAQSQGKLEEVEKAISLELDPYVEKYNGDMFSKFTRSIVQELENGSSHMLTYVFLLQMDLQDFIQLREKIKTKEGTITIDKRTESGLYDIWNGGGSVLEVELEKDIEIPMSMIFDAWIECRGCKANGRGYDVKEVYSIGSSCFRNGSVKVA